MIVSLRSADPLTALRPTWDRARWSGLTAIVGGVLFIRFWLTAEDVLPLDTRAASTTLASGGLALLLGLVGMWPLCAKRVGRGGRIGILLGIFGGLSFAISGAIVALVGQQSLRVLSVTTYILGYLSLIAGAVLLGIVTWRSKALPRWAAFVLVAAPPLMVLVYGIGRTMLGLEIPGGATGPVLTATVLAVAILFGLPWMTLGFALWSGKESSRGQAAGETQ